MKALLFCILTLLATLGCGGYGPGGMAMTPAPNPMFSPPSGTYATPLTVTITESVQGATIYYTVDGSTPTLSSPLYRGSFVLNASARVQAIAAANGYSSSGVVAADYTLQ